MSTLEENIVPIKIAHLAEYVSKVKRISLDDALVYIYINPMYERIYDEGAKWWYLSTEALYKEFEVRRKRQRLDIPKEVFEFYTYCLENYATRKRITGMLAWTTFKETGADEYIIENYDLLHTQGMDYILDDIQRYIKRRKRTPRLPRNGVLHSSSSKMSISTSQSLWQRYGLNPETQANKQK